MFTSETSVSADNELSNMMTEYPADRILAASDRLRWSIELGTKAIQVEFGRKGGYPGPVVFSIVYR
jgi:hypothetical protein